MRERTDGRCLTTTSATELLPPAPQGDLLGGGRPAGHREGMGVGEGRPDRCAGRHRAPCPSRPSPRISRACRHRRGVLFAGGPTGWCRRRERVSGRTAARRPSGPWWGCSRPWGRGVVGRSVFRDAEPELMVRRGFEEEFRGRHGMRGPFAFGVPHHDGPFLRRGLRSPVGGSGTAHRCPPGATGLRIRPGGPRISAGPRPRTGRPPRWVAASAVGSGPSGPSRPTRRRSGGGRAGRRGVEVVVGAPAAGGVSGRRWPGGGGRPRGRWGPS